MRSRLAHCLASLFLFVAVAPAQTESKLDYTITLADAAHHRVHVTMSYDPESGGNQVQLPVWNALYQVRDFAKNVIAVKASSQSGEQLPLTQIDKTTWEFRPKPGWARIEYDVVLDEGGPFGAQFNAHHAFFNFAEVLMYPSSRPRGWMRGCANSDVYTAPRCLSCLCWDVRRLPRSTRSSWMPFGS